MRVQQTAASISTPFAMDVKPGGPTVMMPPFLMNRAVYTKEKQRTSDWRLLLDVHAAGDTAGVVEALARFDAFGSHSSYLSWEATF